MNVRIKINKMICPEDHKDSFRYIGRDRLKLSRLFIQPEKMSRSRFKSLKLCRRNINFYLAREITRLVECTVVNVKFLKLDIASIVWNFLKISCPLHVGYIRDHYVALFISRESHIIITWLFVLSRYATVL